MGRPNWEEIKAVTWHGLMFDLEGGKAQVIFDV